MFRQDFTCPALLERLFILPVRGCHPLWPTFPDGSRYVRDRPGSRSLATTREVSIDVLSSGYLDVSVPRVRLVTLYIQVTIPLRVGFPIRIFTDQSLFATPRDFSQRTTSFIASTCQGIHQMPLKRLICSHYQCSSRCMGSDWVPHHSKRIGVMRPLVRFSNYFLKICPRTP